MLCNEYTTLCCSEQCHLLHRCGRYSWVFSWKTFPCTRTLSTVSSSLLLLRTSSQQLTMASSRYRIAGIFGGVLLRTCYPFICAFPSILQILWREKESEEEHMSLSQYHRRFSAHFTRKGVEYEPTILCYNTKEKKLEVGHLQWRTWQI